MIARDELIGCINRILQPEQFQDYAPNGLQVAGKTQIRRVVGAVTASLSAILAAADANADALLVHHGMFWKNEPPAITGWKKDRIGALIHADINLIAYHLPLDAHPTLGNNAQLAKAMGWLTEQTDGLLCLGRLPESQTAARIADQLQQTLRRKPLVLGNAEQNISRIAWCTGGAQSFFQQAIDAGAQAFVTGEVSEAQYHIARETGTVFFAAGHHATERGGVMALGQKIAQTTGIEFSFYDENNPV